MVDMKKKKNKRCLRYYYYKNNERKVFWVANTFGCENRLYIKNWSCIFSNSDIVCYFLAKDFGTDINNSDEVIKQLKNIKNRRQWVLDNFEELNQFRKKYGKRYGEKFFRLLIKYGIVDTSKIDVYKEIEDIKNKIKNRRNLKKENYKDIMFDKTSKSIEYNGKVFPSISAFYREYKDVLNISKQGLFERLWKGKDPFSKEAVKQDKKIWCVDRYFKDVVDIANFYGIKYKTLYGRQMKLSKKYGAIITWDEVIKMYINEGKIQKK